ncbi:MAG: adaptor protein MecA [Acutalibacteraceae bacterium]
MKIETTDNNCILARLSSEDLDLFELTCDELSFSNEKARQILHKILDEAQTETGNSFDEAKKLKIEVLPDCSGGCLIMLLPCCEEETNTAVYETGSIDNLLDAAAVLKSENLVPENSGLYEKDGVYRLTVTDASERIAFLLNEYLTSVYSDGLLLLRTQEAFNCIYKKNALKILGGAFS